MLFNTPSLYTENVKRNLKRLKQTNNSVLIS